MSEPARSTSITADCSRAFPGLRLARTQAPPAALTVVAQRSCVSPTDAEFKVLYDAHLPLVVRALNQFGVRQSDLMDLTQKVFLIAYLKLPTFEGRSLLSTWLWGICRRVAVGYRRSGAMRYEVATDPTAVEGWLERVGPTIAANFAFGSESTLEDLLGKLSDSQREVFTLAEVHDLDGQQIAALLDVSLGTVRSRLRYARERIRREVRRLDAAGRFANQRRQARTQSAV